LIIRSKERQTAGKRRNAEIPPFSRLRKRKNVNDPKETALSQMTGKRNDSDNTTGKQRSDDHIRAYRSKNG
jgi:hypothetical protein